MGRIQEQNGCPDTESMCIELIEALTCVEQYRRFIFTPKMAAPLEKLGKVKPRLEDILRNQDPSQAAGPDETCRNTLLQSIGQMIKASELLMETPDNNFQQLIMQVMRGFRITCRVLEEMFPFRSTLIPLNQYLMEPGYRFSDAGEGNDTEDPDRGLFHTGSVDERYKRGSASVYIPDTVSRGERAPLIIALHGGFGHGRDFIWTWLREARTRRYMLLAPTSVGNTWGLMNPKEDSEHIQAALEKIKKRWPVDEDRILLTGISDGATFALTECAREHLPVSAYAAVAGTLPPGDLTRAKGKRIYWVHGALDWMFPISRARMYNNLLMQAEADITFKEIPDLSHTYPREENTRILEWFESG